MLLLVTLDRRRNVLPLLNGQLGLGQFSLESCRRVALEVGAAVGWLRAAKWTSGLKRGPEDKVAARVSDAQDQLGSFRQLTIAGQSPAWLSIAPPADVS